MAREYFYTYHSYLKSIEPLNDAERGRLFTALLIYSSQGEVPDLRGNERFIFPTMKEQIDREKANYEAKCATNRKNIGIRWNTTVYEPIPNDTNVSNTKKKTKTKTKEKTKENDKKARARFTPPSVDEVRAYCNLRGNGVDPVRFVNFYASKDWMVGKSKMVDWQASVRTWEQGDNRGKGDANGRSTGNSSTSNGAQSADERWGITYAYDPNAED